MTSVHAAVAARFKGKCPDCGYPIDTGTLRRTGTRSTCPECGYALGAHVAAEFAERRRVSRMMRALAGQAPASPEDERVMRTLQRVFRRTVLPDDTPTRLKLHITRSLKTSSVFTIAEVAGIAAGLITLAALVTLFTGTALGTQAPLLSVKFFLAMGLSLFTGIAARIAVWQGVVSTAIQRRKRAFEGVQCPACEQIIDQDDFDEVALEWPNTVCPECGANLPDAFDALLKPTPAPPSRA